MTNDISYVVHIETMFFQNVYKIVEITVPE